MPMSVHMFCLSSRRACARLAADGAATFRTDQDGLITVRTDGRRISVETFRERATSHSTYPASTSGWLDF